MSDKEQTGGLPGADQTVRCTLFMHAASREEEDNEEAFDLTSIYRSGP